MELEAVVGAVVELGDRLGVPMPATQSVYACAKLLDAHRGERVILSGRAGEASRAPAPAKTEEVLR
jgi:hypothetical protein